MPNEPKCQACRGSKKKCVRGGGDWNPEDPETRCNLCKARNLLCGPDELTDGARQRRGPEDIRGAQPPNLAPRRPICSNADLERKMDELSSSGTFNYVRKTIGSEQNISIPEELCRVLKDIANLADLAHDSGDIIIAELAYRILIDWYTDLGPEVKHLKEGCWIKLGNFSEKIGRKYDAEIWYLKIFDDIGRDFFDQNAEFHHAIRNFNTKGQASQDALMGIIRSCQPSRFKVRNGDDQTPMFLAVTLAEQQVVLAIMKRLRDPRPEVRRLIEQSFLEARSNEITLLSAAIMSSCELPLIEALIEYGSNVNPQIMPNCMLTPLQISLQPGYERFEVAWLLDRYQVRWEDLGPDSDAMAQFVHEMQAPFYESLLPALEPPVTQIEN